VKVRTIHLGKKKYDLIFGIIKFGFYKYSFKKTDMTFLFDWELSVGIVAIRKWQTKKFKELQRMADVAWDKKWKKAGYVTNPKLEKKVKV